MTTNFHTLKRFPADNYVIWLSETFPETLNEPIHHNLGDKNLYFYPDGYFVALHLNCGPVSSRTKMFTVSTTTWSWTLPQTESNLILCELKFG